MTEDRKLSNSDIQWEPSSNEDVKDILRPQFVGSLGWIYWYDPPIRVSFVLTILFSCIGEYYYNCGSSILLFGLLFTFFNCTRSTIHDNIPSVHNPFENNWLPYFGHTLNSLIHWKDWHEYSLSQILKAQTDRPFCAELMLRKCYIAILNPKIVDYLFRVKFGDAEKGENVNNGLKPLLGDGIFTSDGDRWKKHRNIASRIFTVRSLRDYMFQVFSETTDKFVDKLESMRGKDGNDEIDIYDMYNRLTLEAFTQVAFGAEIGCIDIAPKKLPFAVSFDRGFQICTFRFFDPTWKIQKWLNIGLEKELKHHTKIINNFVHNIINQRIKQLSLQSPKLNSFNNNNNNNNEKLDFSNILNSPKIKSFKSPIKTPSTPIIQQKLSSKYDLLSLFLKENSKITHKELRDIAMAFIIAGRDTTAQVLSWFTYRITMNENKHIINNILNEIKQYCTYNKNTKSIEFTFNSINKLQYLENCFLETLRLHPSVPHLVRYAKNDIKIPLESCKISPKFTEKALKRKYCIIRKGNGIVVPCYAMNRLPWLWKDPLKFDPTRFEKKKYAPHELCSFNVAPRLCLGKNVALMEAKIAVVRLLTRYEIELAPNQTVTYVFSVTNQMKHGMKVQLKNRDVETWLN